jgi:hypothetical protein
VFLWLWPQSVIGSNSSSPSLVLSVGWMAFQAKLDGANQTFEPNHIQQPPLAFACPGRLYACRCGGHLCRRHALHQLAPKWFVPRLHIPLPTLVWYASCLEVFADSWPERLPRPEVTPISCAVSITWGYLASGIRAMCPNQRNCRCVSKEANDLTWQLFQMCCKLCQSETHKPMIPLKQLLYADSNRCYWDCVTFQVSAPYTKCGTTKVLNTCTLAPSPKCMFRHTAESWAKAPSPRPLRAFTSAIKLSFEVKIPPPSTWSYQPSLLAPH